MARFWLYLLGMTVCWAAFVSAQSDASPSHETRKQGSGDHGLVLTLSQDQPEPSDSTALKDCLVNHPPPACALLTLTLKNEGKETILSWFGTCNDLRIGFALLAQDGNWKPLPTELWGVCVSDVLMMESLPPGKSDVVHLRLADRSLQISSNGYALLTGPGPLAIRSSWTIWGCIASGNLKADSTPDPVAARGLCVQGTAPKQAIVVALSNKLTMKTTPLGP